MHAQLDMRLSEVMLQCIVHHEVAGEILPLTFRVPATTLCQQFVDDIAVLLSCAASKLFVYYERHSLLDAIDKVYNAPQCRTVFC